MTSSDSGRERVEKFLLTPGKGWYQLSSGTDICASVTSSRPSRLHIILGQSHLPPGTINTRPKPSSALGTTGSPTGISPSRNVTRNRLSYNTSVDCLGEATKCTLISRSSSSWQGRGGGARDASHPKRSPGLGCSCLSFPSTQILNGVQRTFAPASNRARVLEAGFESHTRSTMRCKRSRRRPACARVEPHGCGEMYRSIRRTIASCTSGSVTAVESLSAARMKVPGGAWMEKRLRYVLTFNACALFLSSSTVRTV